MQQYFYARKLSLFKVIIVTSKELLLANYFLHEKVNIRIKYLFARTIS